VPHRLRTVRCNSHADNLCARRPKPLVHAGLRGILRPWISLWLSARRLAVRADRGDLGCRGCSEVGGSRKATMSESDNTPSDAVSSGKITYDLWWKFPPRVQDLARDCRSRSSVKDRRLPIPPGVHLAEEARGGALADIKIRCRRQKPDEAPWFARRRFAWNAGEVSGSLGDLGTFLPHIVGAITVVGMDPTGILTTFGLFYAFAGAFYGIPMAVQPMKAASAAVLIEPMDPAAIAGAGMVIGAFFLLLGATGIVSRIARSLPKTIAAGLQLGL